MSKFKKIAVCCTSIIIILSLSLCFCFSASAATNMTQSSISYDEVGVLPRNYDIVNFKVVNASWYHLDGSFIGGSAVNKISNGYFSFKDTHSAYRGKLEFRIQIEVPLDYLNIPYNYFFEFYANLTDTFSLIDLSHSSSVKYSYAHPDQQLFYLDYFDFINTPDTVSPVPVSKWGYIADNKGIVLKRNIISFSFYIELNNVNTANTCFELLLGGSQYSRNDPSSPGYDNYDDSEFKEYEDLEGSFLDDYDFGSDDILNSEAGRFYSTFSNFVPSVLALTSCFNDFLGEDKLQFIVILSFWLGLFPMIVGASINALRGADRRRAQNNRRNK